MTHEGRQKYNHVFMSWENPRSLLMHLNARNPHWWAWTHIPVPLIHLMRYGFDQSGEHEDDDT